MSVYGNGISGLTAMQKDFCVALVLYGYSVEDAVEYAGYETKKQGKYSGKFSTRAVQRAKAKQLLSSPLVLEYIEILKDGLFEPENVRKDLIREYQATRHFDITDIVYPVEYVAKNGEVRTRIKIKPITEWTKHQREQVVGFDRYGMPIFKDKEKATQELIKLYGFYKQVGTVETEDLEALLQTAGITAYNISKGIPSSHASVEPLDNMDNLTEEQIEEAYKELEGYEEAKLLDREIADTVANNKSEVDLRAKAFMVNNI